MQKIIVAPFLWLGLGASVQAQDTQTLDPLTVTATRTEHSTRLASTLVISREQIETRQIRSVEEALRGMAGINIANTGGPGKSTSIFLRGTESDHILVMVDGVRIGSVTTGSAAFEFMPIAEIDHIEVIKGPRSSLYGTEALGGIIHIHTRRGADRAIKPRFSAGAGSHDRYTVSGGVSGAIADSWYNLNISHDQSNGFNACSSGFNFGCFTVEPDDDGFRNESGSMRLGHKFGDILSLEGNALYASGKNEFDGSVFSGNDVDFIQQVVGGQAKLRAVDFWGLTLKAGESKDRSDSNFNGEDTGIFNTSRVSASAQNDFYLLEGHVLSLGYDYLHDSVDSSTEFKESSRDNHGVFTQYQADIGRHQIILGFRNDHNEQFGSNNTWNAAWGYAFDTDVQVSASVGKGFKAPTFNELYFPFSSNPDLAPERSRSYELGVAGQHLGVDWALNGYLTQVENAIVLDSAFIPQNISKSHIIGIEATAATRVYDTDISAQLSFLDPENRDSGANRGNVLPRRAEKTFRLDVDRRFGVFGFGSTVIAEGRRFDDQANTQRLGGFVTLDLRTEVQLHKTLLLQAKVNNILNKQYQTVAGFNTDDLNFFFTVRYNPEL
ncbi:MAG: TonB-dependent vitamin B12 receptor [Gammaproteobacteria bacterium HGW-Gammaproteobacteria-3]|nr:MAG: TonB-dependent vitamin B12 receptor [Gammaproteobacteria bacterium HGW-Gammaproteobacteria-3]